MTLTKRNGPGVAPNRGCEAWSAARKSLEATYDLRLFDDKVRPRLQLNVRNALKPVASRPSPTTPLDRLGTTASLIPGNLF